MKFLFFILLCLQVSECSVCSNVAVTNGREVFINEQLIVLVWRVVLLHGVGFNTMVFGES